MLNLGGPAPPCASGSYEEMESFPPPAGTERYSNAREKVGSNPEPHSEAGGELVC